MMLLDGSSFDNALPALALSNFFVQEGLLITGNGTGVGALVHRMGGVEQRRAA